MSKLDELKKLKEQLQLQINGKDNIPKDAPSVIICNHNRLMDIFYLPLAFDNDIVSVVSARLVYKNDNKRKKYVNKYLNALPLEAHGGKIYSQMCLNEAKNILKNGISLSIWPEGAYIDDRDNVYKGRTGAARILFDTLNDNKYVYFLPVSIDIKTDDDLDNYISNINDRIDINICNPIETKEYIYSYNNSFSKDEKNNVLHNITDEGMRVIASSLNRNYVDNYIELTPKGNVIFSDGEKIETKEAQKQEYVSKYKNDLKTLSLKLINDIKK